jgi:hypothetical protein
MERGGLVKCEVLRTRGCTVAHLQDGKYLGPSSHRLSVVSDISCWKGQLQMPAKLHSSAVHVKAKTTFALSGNSVTLHKFYSMKL